MTFIENFPCFSIILSLMTSVVSTVCDGKRARMLVKSVVFTVLLMSVSTLAYTYNTGTSVVYQMGHFPAPWGNELRFGMLESFFAVLFGLVLFLCIISTTKDLESRLETNRMNLFYSMHCLIQAALLVFCYTNDVFTGYVFIEICTIASCAILAARGTGRAIAAAIRYMIFSLLGSSLFLLGVVLMYDITGHLLMPQVKETIAELWVSGEYRLPLTVMICMLTVGLSIKAGMFPFHLWMADTYGRALPGAAAVLSGIISKGYIVLLIKICAAVIGMDIFYESGIDDVIFVFGVCGMIAGSLRAISSTDINHMIAWSSAAQIGYIFMGIGISASAGFCAALFHIVAHAINKPTLFISAARLSEVSGGDTTLKGLRGSSRRNRTASVAFSVAAFSMVGIPGFVGFVSKLLFASAGVQATQSKTIITLAALVLSTILNAVYFIRVLLYTYAPDTRTGLKTVHIGEQKRFAVSALCFTAINIALGLHSQQVVEIIRTGLVLLCQKV